MDEIMDQHENEMTKPVVSVVCIAYNQEQYIGQALEGIVMQKTKFPIEILVNDDCSTDGTANIIREYEVKFKDIFHCVYQSENQFSRGINPWWDILFPLARGTYIAICEGDDYWIDPFKLQKQVDFLEEHPDYSLCCSNAKVWDQRKGLFIKDCLSNSPGGEITPSVLASGNKLHTPTATFRRDERISRDCAKLGPLFVGDYVLWLLCLKYGRVFRFKEEMAVYRSMSGVWSNMEGAKKSVLMLMSLCKVRSVIDRPEIITELDVQIEFIKKCAYDIIDSLIKSKCSKSYKLGYALLHPWSLISTKHR